MITKKLMSGLIVLFLLLTHAETQVVQDAQPSQSVIPKRPFNHDARIVTTRLEKEDRTVVTLSEMPVPLPKKKGYSLKLRSSFDYVGKEPIIPRTVDLWLIIENDERIFPLTHNAVLTITYDGDSMIVTPEASPDKADREGLTITQWWPTYSREEKGRNNLIVVLPLEKLVKILGARVVGFRMQRFECQLSENNLEALRDLLSRGK